MQATYAAVRYIPRALWRHQRKGPNNLCVNFRVSVSIQAGFLMYLRHSLRRRGVSRILTSISMSRRSQAWNTSTRAWSVAGVFFFWITERLFFPADLRAGV